MKAAGGSVVMLHLVTEITGTFDAFGDAVGTALRETFGRDHLDALVDNAGTSLAAPYARTTEEQFDTLVGAVATDFDGGVVRDDPDANRAVAGTVTLGRVGLPDDIGAALAAVLSDGFAWADGSRIELSGGQNL